MKKTIKLFVALSIVATLLSGCITATVLMTKWAIDEQKEIKSGKVFKEAQGTVEYSTDTYSSGKIVLQFKEYGKYIYITKPNKDFILITPTDVYKGNITDQTFRHAKNTDGNYYFSNLSMVFPVEWFRWEKFSEYMIADDTNKIEGTEYICGKKCVTFNEDDFKVSGYNRVYMYKKDGRTTLLDATSFSNKFETNFQIPGGCHEVSGTIEYTENF